MQRNIHAILMCLFLLIVSGCSFQQHDEITTKENMNENTISKAQLRINDYDFIVHFYDNDTTATFLATFPLTITMHDLNNHEKYYRFNESLPTEEQVQPAIIKEGEIMLWNDDTLVLFYETFDNTYDGYTRIGFIEHTNDLKKALTKGTITLQFTLLE